MQGVCKGFVDWMFPEGQLDVQRNMIAVLHQIGLRFKIRHQIGPSVPKLGRRVPARVRA